MHPDGMQEHSHPYKSTGYIYGMCWSAALGSILFGYFIGVFNTSFNYIAFVNDWTGQDKDLYESLLAAFLPLGAAMGAALSANMTASFGRRGTFLLADVITMIGVIPTLFNGLSGLLAGRLITGICVGINSSTVPLYISEMSPVEIRGKTGTFHQLFICIASTFSFILGFFLPNEIGGGKGYDSKDHQWWRFMMLVPMFVAGVRILLMSVVYPFETPNYLIQKGQISDAKRVLSFIYHKQNVETVFNSIQDYSGAQSGVNGTSTLLDMFNSSQRWWIFIGCALSGFQQFSGINGVAFYSNKLFRGSPKDPLPHATATFYTVLMGFLLLIAALMSGNIIEKQGRKKLLTYGGSAMVLSLGLLIMFNAAGIDSVSRLCILIFAFAFGLSWGPVVWVIISESLSSSGVAAATMVNWLCCIIVVQTLPFIVNSWMGINGAFLIYLSITLAGVAFVSSAVPETKGLSKSEIQAAFYSGSSRQEALPVHAKGFEQMEQRIEQPMQQPIEQ